MPKFDWNGKAFHVVRHHSENEDEGFTPPLDFYREDEELEEEIDAPFKRRDSEVSLKEEEEEFEILFDRKDPCASRSKSFSKPAGIHRKPNWQQSSSSNRENHKSW